MIGRKVSSRLNLIIKKFIHALKSQSLFLWLQVIESTIRTAELGLPIVYAIIGGDPLHFKPLIRLYKRVAEKMSNDLTTLPIAAHYWGWLNQDKEKAIKDYFYPTKLLVDQISTERPQWNGMTYEQYLEAVGENGAIFVGDSETVANKIIKV